MSAAPSLSVEELLERRRALVAQWYSILAGVELCAMGQSMDVLLPGASPALRARLYVLARRQVDVAMYATRRCP